MKKRNVYLALVLAGGVMFYAGRVTARSGSLSQETRDNLSTAMHGEAFAYAKYLAYKLMHPDAKLTKPDVALVCEWTRSNRQRLSAVEAEVQE